MDVGRGCFLSWFNTAGFSDTKATVEFMGMKALSMFVCTSTFAREIPICGGCQQLVMFFRFTVFYIIALFRTLVSTLLTIEKKANFKRILVSIVSIIMSWTVGAVKMRNYFVHRKRTITAFITSKIVWRIKRIYVSHFEYIILTHNSPKSFYA